MTSILNVLAIPPTPIQLLVAAAILVAEPALLAGFVLPSATAALLLGFLAHGGLVPLPVVLGTAAAAVVCGDTIGYAVGRRRAQRGPPATGSHLAGNPPNRSWIRLYGRVQQSIATVHRPRAARLVARHGGGTVFLARWLAGARTLVPRMVGEGGTSAWGFARWSVPAGLAWSSTYVLAGYLGGGSLDEVSGLLSRAVLGTVAVIVTVGAAAILLRRSVRRPPAAAQPRTTPRASPPPPAGSEPLPAHQTVRRQSRQRAATAEPRYPRDDPWRGSGLVGSGYGPGAGGQLGQFLLRDLDLLVDDDQFVDQFRRKPTRRSRGGRGSPRARLLPRLRRRWRRQAARLSEADVGKHIGNILAKLSLPPTEDTNRRVLAVLTYLRDR
jgi:membrane protein DedA with SNARE-associated domain